jgi:hypothetical protein
VVRERVRGRGKMVAREMLRSLSFTLSLSLSVSLSLSLSVSLSLALSATGIAADDQCRASARVRGPAGRSESGRW